MLGGWEARRNLLMSFVICWTLFFSFWRDYFILLFLSLLWYFSFIFIILWHLVCGEERVKMLEKCTFFLLLLQQFNSLEMHFLICLACIQYLQNELRWWERISTCGHNLKLKASQCRKPKMVSLTFAWNLILSRKPMPHP